MNIFSRIFRKGEDPIEKYNDSDLGDMIWDSDEESWVGTYDNFKYLLSYEYKAEPTPEIIQYAKSVLFDTNWLNSTLDTCKSVALKDYPENRHSEIQNLKYKRFCFQGDNMILIQFFERDDEPYWSADIVGVEFRGIGCDT